MCPTTEQSCSDGTRPKETPAHVRRKTHKKGQSTQMREWTRPPPPQFIPAVEHRNSAKMKEPRPHQQYASVSNLQVTEDYVQYETIYVKFENREKLKSTYYGKTLKKGGD